MKKTKKRVLLAAVLALCLAGTAAAAAAISVGVLAVLAVIGATDLFMGGY